MTWTSGPPLDKVAVLCVVSPHLDDAVLSLGATIAHAVRAGLSVNVLTILAGDPTSDRPSDPDNRAAGFATVGDASRTRRREDSIACRRLGATPVWLPFNDDAAYHRDSTAAWIEVGGQLQHADAVLLPGFPLDHPDHRWTTRMVLERAPQWLPVGLYVEQPYTAWRLLRPRPHHPVAPSPETGPPPLRWRRSGSCPACAYRKLAAISAYRSQLPILRRWPRTRISVYELLSGGERIAWLPSGARAAYRTRSLPGGKARRWRQGEAFARVR